MVAFPVPVAVSSPVVAPIVATLVLELLHVPPVVAQARVVVPPVHKVCIPVMASGCAPPLTVL